MSGADRAARRILFSVAGGYGHLHPLVPLARALQGRGYPVAFAASESLRWPIEAAGFAVFPVGGNLAADPEYQQVKARMATLPLALESELFIYTRLWCGVLPRLRTPQVVEIAQQWGPAMLIREAGEYGAAIAAEHLGLPHVTVSFAASLTGLARFEQGAAAQLDPTRRAWGLPPDPELAALYRFLFLCYAPPSISLQAVEDGAAPGRVPATTRFIRPAIFDQAESDPLPAWMADLAPRPTVYVTLGTEANKEPGVYPDVLQTIIAGLRDLPITLIVTLGRAYDPADFGPQPANVHIARYIPQSLLLPHCALMVMHGGSNSLLAAVDVGLPLVVVPLIADQFFNAQITARLGLGQAVPRAELTPARIGAAVTAVLSNRGYRQVAARLQAEMHALPDPESAVDLIESILAGPSPARS